jgi:hypothetical protein
VEEPLQVRHVILARNSWVGLRREYRTNWDQFDPT